MMNPDGLELRLLLMLGFTDQVLTSWPGRARHAWCCMPAQPQNLDIGRLLQSPSMSPFALALQSLVVPNWHKSVYTRLWCGYEAFLALESNKIIRMATPPNWREVWCSWLRMVPALIGLIVGIVFNLGRMHQFMKFINENLSSLS